MTRKKVAWRFVSIASLLASVALQAQASDPTVTILQPSSTSVLRRRVELEAAVAPGSMAVRSVTFFVDGQQVCRVALQPYHCEWDAGTLVAPRSVRVVAELADGRRVVSTVRTSGRDPSQPVFSSSVDAVSVPVRVRDPRGRPVRGLPAGAFRILEDGASQTVGSLATDSAAPSLLLALDMSASMDQHIVDLRRAAETFLDGVKDYPSVSLAAFNNGLFVLARPGSDAVTRRTAVGRLRPWGGTALYDSLIRAVDLIKTQPAPRAVVVFTDGDDMSSVASVEGVRSAFLGDDVTLYLVVRADEPKRGSPAAILAEIAEKTGGAAMFTSKMSSLGERFTEIVADLATRYVLSYVPAKPLGDGAWRALKVEISGPERSYAVESRQGYFATSRSGPGR